MENMKPVSAMDVARYILNKCGPMTAMKLQKLVYYSQAWSLVWDDTPLFKEKVEAWFGGPVVRELYNLHRGRFKLTKRSWLGGGDSRKLNKVQKETVDAVLKYYGDKSAHWLSELTHRERPWREARVGLESGERGNQVISHASMAEYYSGLKPNG